MLDAALFTNRPDPMHIGRELLGAPPALLSQAANRPSENRRSEENRRRDAHRRRRGGFLAAG